MSDDAIKCEICHEVWVGAQQKHGVMLCPTCCESHKRGLLPRSMLEQFKSGEWIPLSKEERAASAERAEKSWEDHKRRAG